VTTPESALVADHLAARERRRSRSRRTARAGYWLYLVPMIAGTLAIVLIPFAMNVYISLFRWKGGMAPMRWNGLQNYVDLFGDELFWLAFKNTIFMILGIVVVPTVIGLLLAAMLFDYIGREFGARAAAFLRATYYLPQILPIAVAGFIWSWVLATQDGLLNGVIEALGVRQPPDWLGDPDIAIYAVVLMLIWLQIGYPVVIFMAALQRVDPELHEAAALDGAGWWRRFAAITIPQIRPEVFVVVITATVGALKVFAPVLILTGGGPEGSTVVPSYYSYRNFFELSKVGYGSAIATAMSIVIFLVAGVMLWLQRRDGREETAA
jgi:raffinose/stachyose/melibiose transport system permease protein